MTQVLPSNDCCGGHWQVLIIASFNTLLFAPGSKTYHVKQRCASPINILISDFEIIFLIIRTYMRVESFERSIDCRAKSLTKILLPKSVTTLNPL